MLDVALDPSLPVWGTDPVMDAGFGADGDGWSQVQQGMNVGSQGLNDVLKLINSAAQLDPKSPVNQQQQAQAAALQQQYQQALAQGNAAAQAQIAQLVAAQKAQTDAMLAEQNARASMPSTGVLVAVGGFFLAAIGLTVALIRR